MPARAAALAVALCGLARAGELRDFCADRPGNGTPACTIDPGHVMVEVGLVDWTRDRQDAARTDTWTAGDILLRYGVGQSTELQLGWTAYGVVRTRDDGADRRASGSGDVRIALRQNLQNPDGGGVSFALMPFLTLPAGGDAIGAGKWSGGLILPVGLDLGDDVSLGLTAELDAAPNSGRGGRHAAYGGTIGLAVPLSRRLAASLEFTLSRDLDPDGHSSARSAAVSFAWQVADDVQLDLGSNFGVDRKTAGAELYAGIASRF